MSKKFVIAAFAVLSVIAIPFATPAEAYETKPPIDLHMSANSWALQYPPFGPCTAVIMVGTYINASYAKFSDQAPKCNDVTISVEAVNPVFGLVTMGPCSLGNTTPNGCSTNATGGFSGGRVVQATAIGTFSKAVLNLCIISNGAKVCQPYNITITP